MTPCPGATKDKYRRVLLVLLNVFDNFKRHFIDYFTLLIGKEIKPIRLLF